MLETRRTVMWRDWKRRRQGRWRLQQSPPVAFSHHDSNQISIDCQLLQSTLRMCDGRINEDSVRFPLSCNSAITFKSLHSERSPCPSIISTWRWWMDGLGVRMKAREEAHTLNHLMGLSFKKTSRSHRHCRCSHQRDPLKVKVLRVHGVLPLYPISPAVPLYRAGMAPMSVCLCNSVCPVLLLVVKSHP